MDHAIILILTLITGADKQDISHKMNEPSIEQCLADAKEFLAGGTPQIEGVVGIAAACTVPRDTPV